MENRQRVWDNEGMPRSMLHSCTRLLIVYAALLVCCPLPSPGQAGSPSVTPPAVGMKEDFSHVVGSYRIQASVNKTETIVEQPLELTVLLQGTGPKEWQPRLEKLKLFRPEAEKAFFIEPVPESTQAFPEKEYWLFVYRLRPRTEGEQIIPGLKLNLYNPTRRKYETRYSDAIPITVRPAEEKKVVLDLKVIPAPASFFAVRPARESAWVWSTINGIVLFGLPLGCILLYLWWQRRHGTENRLRARRRSQAAQKALALLTRSRRAEEINDVAVSYLRERLDFPALEATASEVRRFLLQRGATRALARQWEAFVQTCDAHRFPPARPASADDLHRDARELIHASEEQPCWHA